MTRLTRRFRFDVAFAKLLFNDMLNVSIRFLPSATWLEFYLALREGRCDVFVTALEMERSYSTCDDTCPPVPPGGFDLAGADYASGWTEELRGAF